MTIPPSVVCWCIWSETSKCDRTLSELSPGAREGPATLLLSGLCSSPWGNVMYSTGTWVYGKGIALGEFIVVDVFLCKGDQSFRIHFCRGQHSELVTKVYVYFTYLLLFGSCRVGRYD